MSLELFRFNRDPSPGKNFNHGDKETNGKGQKLVMSPKLAMENHPAQQSRCQHHIFGVLENMSTMFSTISCFLFGNRPIHCILSLHLTLMT
jgi:hypothetical protein